MFFLDASDSDYNKDCLAGPQGSVLDISITEDNLNDDEPVASHSDKSATFVGGKTESEDSDFILCPMEVVSLLVLPHTLRHRMSKRGV